MLSFLLRLMPGGKGPGEGPRPRLGRSPPAAGKERIRLKEESKGKATIDNRRKIQG